LPKIKRKARSISSAISTQSLLQRVQKEIQPNQSYLSLVLGLLIVIVAGILVFNFFKGSEPSLGPSQNTVSEVTPDVKPENLPGKYTVKEGDTLFSIAEKYYNDGYQYPKIAETNKLANSEIINTGQVLEIPKLETTAQKAETTVAPSQDLGTGGATNLTIWGEKITGDSYTVVEGDWLSTIAGRSYGDIMAYTKIAEANKITNPDIIEPGQVLKIPR